LDWIEVQNNNQSTNIESISKNQFKKWDKNMWYLGYFWECL
jgi:hypothetical protein